MIVKKIANKRKKVREGEVFEDQSQIAFGKIKHQEDSKNTPSILPLAKLMLEFHRMCQAISANPVYFLFFASSDKTNTKWVVMAAPSLVVQS